MVPKKISDDKNSSIKGYAPEAEPADDFFSWLWRVITFVPRKIINYLLGAEKRKLEENLRNIMDDSYKAQSDENIKNSEPSPGFDTTQFKPLEQTFHAQNIAKEKQSTNKNSPTITK